MSSILDWVAANAANYSFDLIRIVARGISTGGYYAMRIAHTHADRLFAVVAQGGGCHYMFEPEWIRAQNQMEYPFALAEALAYKFGYRGTDPVAGMPPTRRSLTCSRPECWIVQAARDRWHGRLHLSDRGQLHRGGERRQEGFGCQR
jgi:acetyl esterase/lipase